MKIIQTTTYLFLLHSLVIRITSNLIIASLTWIRENVFQFVNVKIIKAYLAWTLTTYFGVHSHVTPESIDTYFSVTTSIVPLPLEKGGDQESHFS